MSRDARLVLVLVVLGLGGLALVLFVIAGQLRMGRTGVTGIPWEKRVARVSIIGDIYDPHGVVDELRQWGSQKDWKKISEPEILFAPVD